MPPSLLIPFIDAAMFFCQLHIAIAAGNLQQERGMVESVALFHVER